MEIDLSFSYLVGTLDTRGFFWINERKIRSLGRGCGYHWAHGFQYQSTHQSLCVYLRDFFNMGIVKKRQYGHIQYSWYLMGQELDNFCNKIHPHLIFTKKHCEKMMEFRSTYQGFQGKVVPSDIVDRRKEITVAFEVMSNEHRNKDKT